MLKKLKYWMQLKLIEQKQRAVESEMQFITDQSNYHMYRMKQLYREENELSIIEMGLHSRIRHLKMVRR